jgi:hypothetical protein
MLGLLEAIGGIGVLPGPDVELLSDAYRVLRERINHRVLQDEPALVGQDELVQERADVCRIWGTLMGEG